MSAGSGGLSGITQDGGPVDFTSVGAATTITASTNAAGQDLVLQVVGATDSSVIVTSSGTGTDAIKLDATAGGIRGDATGIIQIETTDTTNGINLATATSGVPVKIGTSNSLTTIYGNLDVLGTTTSIESTVLTVDDNIIFVNNAPSGTSDGGLAVKRFQSANDLGTGDVIADPPAYSDTAQGGSTTTITLDTGASAVDDAYAGYWIEITGGTGANQVRRIKSYNGTTKVATIYTTADQTGVLGNPTPIEGLDFTTAPDATSEFELHDCGYVVTMWDESLNEWAIVCTSIDPTENVVINHYADLHINDLIANNITANSINNLVADTVIDVILTDNSSVPVTCSDFPESYGIFIVIVRPDTAVATRPSAVFVLGRLNDATFSGDANRLLSVRGSTGNAQLRMAWPTNAKPTLFYSPNPSVAGTTSYKLRLMTV
jgi:hypothetical protein